MTPKRIDFVILVFLNSEKWPKICSPRIYKMTDYG